MKKLIALLLALSLLALCGCGNGTDEPSSEPSSEPQLSSEPSTDPSTEPSTEPEETEPEETEPVTEPAPQYRNPLTGEVLDAPHETRIVSLSIGNTKDAMPVHGLSQADIVFEMYVNHFTTRLLALYTDPSDVPAIGSIRSHRYHFTDISQSYDTIALSAGGSNHVISDARRSGIDWVSIDTSSSNYYCFRDRTRRSSGYAHEHCLFAYGAGLYQLAEAEGFSTTMDPDKDYCMEFTDGAALTEGQTANTVSLNLTLQSSSKNTTMTYNAETGLYEFSQYGMAMVDGNNSQRISFRNVFIILADTNTDSNGYHVSNILGSGNGYFACDGYMVPVQWHRETDNDPFTFTFEDGTPVVLGVGSSYMAIAPLQSSVTVE